MFGPQLAQLSRSKNLRHGRLFYDTHLAHSSGCTLQSCMISVYSTIGTYDFCHATLDDLILARLVEASPEGPHRCTATAATAPLQVFLAMEANTKPDAWAEDGAGMAPLGPVGHGYHQATLWHHLQNGCYQRLADELTNTLKTS